MTLKTAFFVVIIAVLVYLVGWLLGWGFVFKKKMRGNKKFILVLTKYPYILKIKYNLIG